MPNELLVLEKAIIKPEIPTFMIAGFDQWANAGDVSSGIPEYLIEKLGPKKIGHIRKGDFYLFQLPGSQSMFRPPIKYVDGYEIDYQEEPINNIYYAKIGGKGLVIFIGTEPNQHDDVYINTLLDAATELGVKRLIVPAGVGGEVPFDKERRVSCTYSLKHMKEELENYALRFSNYSRNATLGMVINHYSKERNIESVRMSAQTPSYQVPVTSHNDKRAMYDILRRIRHMFGLELDFSDIEKEIKQQIADYDNALKKLFVGNPEIEPQITKYMDQIEEEFEELRFEEPTQIPDVFLKEFKELP
ncbi:PAC2 family protein [Chloroflexota bacterium]